MSGVVEKSDAGAAAAIGAESRRGWSKDISYSMGKIAGSPPAKVKLQEKTIIAHAESWALNAELFFEAVDMTECNSGMCDNDK